MQYKFKYGSRVTGDPQLIGEELEKIRRKRGLSRHSLVEEAKKPRHPLHNLFPWDDRVAGPLYRLELAGRIINSVIVEIQEVDQKPIPIQVFHPIGGKTERFVHIKEIRTSAEKRKMVLEQALKELKAFRGKYARLKELNTILQAAEEAVEELAMAA